VPKPPLKLSNSTHDDDDDITEEAFSAFEQQLRDA